MRQIGVVHVCLCVDARLTHHHPTARHHCTKNCTAALYHEELAGTYPNGENNIIVQDMKRINKVKEGHFTACLPYLTCSCYEHQSKTSQDPHSHQNYDLLKPTLRK